MSELDLWNDHKLFDSGDVIIDINDKLFYPKGFNLKPVSGRSYKIFQPVFTAEKNQLALCLDLDTDVIYPHLMAARTSMHDVIGEEYLFIRAYRVGHTIDGESIIAVVESQLSGGSTCIDDDDGYIGGHGKGKWFIALCPEHSESELLADIKSDEARRRKSLPKMQWRRDEERESKADTSELP
jgi:hypothetical protein